MRDGLMIDQTVLLSFAELGIKVLRANRQLDVDQGSEPRLISASRDDLGQYDFLFNGYFIL